MIDEKERARYKALWQESIESGEKDDAEHPEEAEERRRELSRLRREQALAKLKEDMK